MSGKVGLRQKFEFLSIGTIQSCFKEKFGIPRQPGLASGADAVLKLHSGPEGEPFLRQALKGLETFSHVWIVFVFHRHDARNWKPQIRPPRLGGARKVGSLASRSPHRPNPIGLSAVRLKRIDWDAPGGVEIHLEGVDLLDGTPVLDIKPYLPYADRIEGANAGWAHEEIRRTPVELAPQALLAIEARSGEKYPQLERLITEMLELDPRPAFQKRKLPAESPEAQGTRYGFRLFEFDVKWEIRDGRFVVLDVVDLD